MQQSKTYFTRRGKKCLHKIKLKDKNGAIWSLKVVTQKMGKTN